MIPRSGFLICIGGALALRKGYIFSDLRIKVKSLPFAAVQPVQFLRCQEELLHHFVLRIELHEFAVDEGVEAAQIRTHAVCGQGDAGNVEGERFAVSGAVEAETAAVQAQPAAADDLGGCLILQQLIFRQHAKLHIFFQSKVLLLHFLTDQFPFHLEPGGLGLRNHTGLVERNQLIGIQQCGAVAALLAENGVARGGHGVLLAAAGAPEQQIFQILCAVLSDVIVVLVDLVPGIIIVVNGTVDFRLDLGGGHTLQVLHREQLVILHLHMAHPIPEVILGAGKIAASDHAVVDRYFVVFEKLARAQGHRLVGAGNRAHALRENADAVAGFDDPADLLYRVEIRGEILLGNDPKKIEYQ